MADVRKKLAIPTGSVTLAVVLSLVSLVFFDLMGLVIKSLSADYGAAELSAYRRVLPGQCAYVHVMYVRGAYMYIGLDRVRATTARSSKACCHG